MSEIAVTGASGFIGRVLIGRLLAAGETPVAISRQPLEIAGARNVAITDYARTAELAAHLSEVEALIHLAGRAHQASHPGQDEALFEAANIDTALYAARACMAAGVKRFVFVSSIGVNGNHSAKPFLDTDEPAPTEPYAVSKWKAEQALGELLAGSPTELTIIRPPLVYGPGCPGNFRKLVRLAATSRWIPLGALDAPRSFIHVVNLADALITAARHPGLDRETFLVADARDITVGEVVRILAGSLHASRARVINVPVLLLKIAAFLLGRRALFDKLAAPLQVDASRFSRVTGWKPEITVEKGLRDTAKAFEK
ncbi:NAD-dependent epimerase/dehydratase family protein [Hydrogenophaga laconesensis]|uniref:Nucleoside-diphosphate-sugar epimerase n=1 Tax=Hydrogenophaga laconesensis TaxID=1805971 RepID=A0ABU1VGZ8_9BURK|nr:NAD-dependent epimerase/dehydratase family protein [Hydrogenophaga laconesensis]MDR7096756.1 nucleoside-diphosphate-sugar epimerase [Hydrogenophaga laconesensis]